MINKAVNKVSKRILVIGCPGTGKSTFSKKLAQVLNLEVIHLDKHFWKPGWVQSTSEEWTETVSELIAKDKWIMDGNYSRTLLMRAQRADEIIFFDYSSLFCVYRILKRNVKSKLNLEVRDDLADGCPEKWFDLEFIKFTWDFNKNIRPINYRILEELEFNKKKISIFKNAADGKYYLDNLYQNDFH